MTEALRTPSEWLVILHPGLKIMDPDGWRSKDAPSFETPITQEEFEWRLLECTLMGTSA